LAEVGLAGVGNFLEVDDDAGLMGFDGVFDDILHKKVASGRIGEKLHHFLNAPDDAIVVVEHAHRRQIKGGVGSLKRLEPLMELVLFEKRDSLRRGGYRSVLAVFVIDDGQVSVGRNAVQLLGDEQVDVFVMFFQRSEAVGVPTHVKSSAQRIVACRHFADVGDAALAALPEDSELLFRCFQSVERGFNVGEKTRGKLDTDHDGDKEIREQDGKKSAGDFHGAPREAPAHALRVVKNGTAFFHECLRPVGMAAA
jgi:hypothetical protein